MLCLCELLMCKESYNNPLWRIWKYKNSGLFPANLNNQALSYSNTSGRQHDAMHNKPWALMVSVRKLLSSRAVICCHVSSNIIVWGVIPKAQTPTQSHYNGVHFPLLRKEDWSPESCRFSILASWISLSPLLRLYRIPAAAFPVFSTHWSHFSVTEWMARVVLIFTFTSHHMKSCPSFSFQGGL